MAVVSVVSVAAVVVVVVVVVVVINVIRVCPCTAQYASYHGSHVSVDMTSPASLTESKVLDSSSNKGTEEGLPDAPARGEVVRRPPELTHVHVSTVEPSQES